MWHCDCRARWHNIVSIWKDSWFVFWGGAQKNCIFTTAQISVYNCTKFLTTAQSVHNCTLKKPWPLVFETRALMHFGSKPKIPKSLTGSKINGSRVSANLVTTHECVGPLVCFPDALSGSNYTMTVVLTCVERANFAIWNPSTGSVPTCFKKSKVMNIVHWSLA